MIISGDSLPEASDKKCNKSRKLCAGKQVRGVIGSADINKREGSTYDIRKLKTRHQDTILCWQIGLGGRADSGSCQS